MKRTSFIISGAAAAILVLTGCGSDSAGDGNSASDNNSIGTGYYLDSAVAGVSYTCGSQTGVTDKDGKFTFEKGEECTFSVAGITLRKVPAENLADDAKIVETDLKVAKFLQSIDTDGNLENGIQITDKVIDVMTKAFEENNITSVPQDENKLATVVNEIKNEVPDFKGEVKTEEEVQKHLSKTQENVLKVLLAGRTFYVINHDDYGKVVFDSSMTKITYTGLDGEDAGQVENQSFTVDGNRINWIGEGGDYTIAGVQTKDYIEFTDYNFDGTIESHTRLYYNKVKAEAYYESVKSDNGNSDEGDDDGDNKKVPDLISGHINFVDLNGSAVSVPANVWIRITPEENQIEGNWNGVNCKLDANGDFGNECYVHTNIDRMKQYFTSSYTKNYQFIPYIEKNGDTHFSREEEGFGGLYKPDGGDPFMIHYGEWKNATVVIFSH